MTLYELWACAPQSFVFIKNESGTVEEYTGTKGKADSVVKSVKATSYPMFNSVLEVAI